MSRSSLEQRVIDLENAGSGVSTFLALTDTPAAYTGQSLKVVRVNAGETALEFITLAGGGDMLAANNLSDVSNVATARTNLGLNTTANQTDSTDKRFMSDAQEAKLDAITGTNTGDQTSIVGISGTKANFDSACSDGNFLYVGDIVGVTDGWTTIVKSANQDVTGSTFTDDTELQFSVVAGGNYMLELHISTSGNSSTDDYKFQFLVSTGTMIGGGNAIHRSATSAATNTALTATSVAATTSVPIGQNGGTIPTSSGVISATANYAFRASADATFKLQFACNSGTTSVARTWKGSILRYKRID